MNFFKIITLISIILSKSSTLYPQSSSDISSSKTQSSKVQKSSASNGLESAIYFLGTALVTPVRLVHYYIWGSKNKNLNHLNGTKNFDWSPDGQRLALDENSVAQNKIYIFDEKSGERTHILQNSKSKQESRIEFFCFINSRELLVVTSKTVEIWNLEINEYKTIHTFEKSLTYYFQAKFSKVNNLLAISGSNSGQSDKQLIQVFEIDFEKRQVQLISKIDTFHSDFNFSGDGVRLAIRLVKTNEISIYNIQTATLLKNLKVDSNTDYSGLVWLSDQEISIFGKRKNFNSDSPIEIMQVWDIENLNKKVTITEKNELKFIDYDLKRKRIFTGPYFDENKSSIQETDLSGPVVSSKKIFISENAIIENCKLRPDKQVLGCLILKNGVLGGSTAFIPIKL